MGKLSGKVAIVTGASKGIGAGIAKSLAQEGAAVVVNYSASKAAAEQVVSEIVKKDGKAIAVQGDVAKASDIRKLFEETKKAFGALDILVNNAGVYQFDPIEAVTETEFHRQFNTNVLGPILTAQEAVKYFGSKGGNIINVGSVAASLPPPGSVIYSSTKGALDVVTKVLSAELAGKKIRVNSLNPGPIETEGFVSSGLKGTEFEKALVARVGLGRIGTPDDIARVAVFLASEDSGWITGEALRVSGGYV